MVYETQNIQARRGAIVDPRPATIVDRFLPQNSYPVAPYEERNLIDATFIRAALWRQRAVIVGVTALALVIGLIATLMATPIYEARATLRVNPYYNPIIEGQDIVDPYINANEIQEYVATLASVVESRRLALRVVDALNLTESEELLGADAAADDVPEARREALRQRAANIVRAGVSTQTERDTRIMSVAYRSPDPVFAATITNAYAENFILDDLSRGSEENAYAREYLQEQIADVRAALQEAESRSINYARDNRLIGQGSASTDPSGEAGSTAATLTASNLVNLNSSLAQARGERIRAEQRWRAVANVPASQIAEVQQNGTVQLLEQRRASLSADIASLRQRYQDDYPEIQELLSQVQVLEQQLNQTRAEVKASIRNNYEIARRQEAAMSGEVSALSTDTLNEQDKWVQYNLINREVDSYRTQLAGLMNRFNQITAAANLRSTDITMLDTATVPGGPVSPNMLQNLLISLIIGLGLAGGIAVLREALDDKVRSLDEVRSKLGLKSLGQTPHVDDDVSDELEDAFSPVSEAYSSIRASLDWELGGDNARVIQFTSASASEGKSTSVLALARKYAAIGRRVLLVDLDLRRPSTLKQIGGALPDADLVDVLFGRAPLSSALLSVDDKNLHVLGVRRIPQNPVEILSSGLTAELFEGLRSHYDLILVDSSPVMGIADAPLLSRNVDGVVFIVEANGSASGQVRTALQRLESGGAHLIGAVLTKYKALQAGQSYAYQYQYYTYEAKSG